MVGGSSVAFEGRVAIRLLGPPVVERDGEPVSLDTRKAVAILAYLALTGRPQSRETLADLLWPDSDPDRARAALRRTLSVLNKALDGAGLTIDRRQVGLVDEQVWVDVHAFRELVADGGVLALTEAVELCRGDLLAGFGLRDSAEFDEWQMAQADGSRRELARALERLSVLADVDEAITYTRQLLELDLLHEPAHRRLMELYAQVGDRTAALAQYRTCVSVLERELGVAPVAETNELYEAIREGRVAPAQVVVPSTPLPADELLPLVGRDAELDELERIYREIDADGRFVVIEGEAGIGKTRLATELLERAAARGAKIYIARCHEGESGLAYGPVSALVRDIAAAADLDADVLVEVERLLPGRRTAVIPVRGSAARTRFFESILEVLAAGASGTVPGVIFVDDVQWADVASGLALSFVARRLAGRRILLLVATRREGAGAALRRMRSAHLVRLERLSRDEVAQLAVGRGETDEEAVDRLYEETEGVPFFLASYLSTGTWDAEVPPAVRDAVESRIAGLGDEAAQALTAAAVVGSSFDAETLRAASGRSEEETVTAIEELEGRGLIIEVTAATYDFSHHKIRSVALDRTTPARARLLHRRVAKALARRTRRDRALSAVVARHFREAGELDEAARHFRLAGDHARRLFANAEALAHYREALALGASASPDLREAIADLEVLEGDYRAAVSGYESALALGADIATLEHKLGDVHLRLGSFDVAASHLAEAVEHADDEGQRARIDSDRALNAHRVGRSEEAAVLARRALEAAERAEDRGARAQAHNILGMLATRRGALAEARTELERSLTLAQRLDDPAARVAALNNLALAHRTEGNLGEALGCGERALELCVRMGDRHREAALRSNIADILRDAGREEEAIEQVKLSAAILTDVGEHIEGSNARPPTQPEVWKLVEW